MIHYIIFLGPPGSGKGTQAERLAQSLNVEKISTGDLIREEIQKKSELGNEIKPYLESGALVPDSIVYRMIENAVKRNYNKGFISDGFPRNVEQSKFFDTLLRNTQIKSQKIFLLDVKKEDILKRILQRRICPDCKTIYHLEINPSKNNGICDKCGAELVQRADDSKEIIIKRYHTYEKSTELILKYYGDRIIKIDGSQTQDAVFSEIKTHLS